MKQRIAAVYRRVVPEPIRRFIRDRLSGRGFYSRAFFDQMDRDQAASYDVLAETIVERLRPSAVIDVGSGSGGLLAALARRGVPTLVGLESSPAGAAAARRRNVDVRMCDLSQPFVLERRFDVAVCLEVAEHLPESVADQFADGLTSGPDVLLFSAATPGQGGTALSQAAWLPVLRTLGMRPWFEGRVLISGAGKIFDREGRITDAATQDRLRTFVAGFAAFVETERR